MSSIEIVREYPHSPEKLWRVITDPTLIARWLMRPEGFAPQVGTRFRLVAKPQPGWRGYVDCVITEVVPEKTIAYSWCGDDNGTTTQVRYTLEPSANGTRLVFAHTGFTGFGGFLLAKLMLGPGWKKMMGRTMPKILDAMGPDGTLDTGASIVAKYGEPVVS